MVLVIIKAPILEWLRISKVSGGTEDSKLERRTGCKHVAHRSQTDTSTDRQTDRQACENL